MDESTFELGTDGPSTMLVGIDGSETSLRAAAYAAGMARRQGIHLVALYVIPSTSVTAQMAATAGAMVMAQDDLSNELRATVLENAQRTGISAEFVQRSGNPYKELIAVAHELRVDAIVVGASTQAGHRLVGSLAGRLVKDASWPITVVP